MPTTVLKNLIERAEKLDTWRSRLTGNDLAVVRCEVAFEAYLEARRQIFERARTVSETKGLQGGLKRALPLLQAKQDEIRTLIGENRLDPEVGKGQVKALAEAAFAVKSEVESVREEMMREAGKVDGIAACADAALGKIEAALENHERQLRVAAEDDEDWSGRGTAKRKVKKSPKKAPRRKRQPAGGD